jgi:hypothetical protein
MHLQRAVRDVADDLRLGLQLQEVVGVIGPLTVPLITTCDTLISPSILACSLTTSVPSRRWPWHVALHDPSTRKPP